MKARRCLLFSQGKALDIALTLVNHCVRMTVVGTSS